jgi:transcriptional regulator with XRE-family HTH domain
MDRMREARIESGLTQAEVAAALDRPRTFVSKCELGDRRIDPVDLDRLAELYEKPLDYFLPKRQPRKPRTRRK